MVNVVGYVRVSTQDQIKRGHGIDIQEESIRRYCKAFAHKLIRIYKDEGISAYKDRPAFEAMKKRLFNDSMIGGVIVNDLTRFGRSTDDLLRQIREIDETNKKFISVKDNIDISTKNGRLLLTMLSAIADYETETIRERMNAGREWAKIHGTESGKPMHRPSKIDDIDWSMVKLLRKSPGSMSWTKIAKRMRVSLPTMIKHAKQKGIYD